MRDLGKITMGGATVIAVNTGIQFLIAGAPFKKVEDRKMVGKDFLALGLQLGTSGAAYFLLGPVPAILGGIEALTFLGLRLAGVGAPAPMEVINKEEPKLVPATVLPSKGTIPSPSTVKPEEPGGSLPEDFSGPDSFSNPEDFYGKEDFSNPEELTGVRHSQHNIKFIR